MQAAWNYKGQQNLGFAAALLPGLKKIYGPEAPDLASALTRSLKPFNTQPYMGGPLLGAMIKTEELGPDNGFPYERIERLKTALMAALAAVGDAFFWNALLPAAAVIGMFWAVRGRLAGLIIFLVTYNLFHLILRIGGFWMGYYRGLGIISAIDRLALPAQALRVRLFLSGALGALAAWVLSFDAPAVWSRTEILIVGLAAGPVIYASARFLRRGLPVEALIYGLLAAVLAWTHIMA